MVVKGLHPRLWEHLKASILQHTLSLSALSSYHSLQTLSLSALSSNTHYIHSVLHAPRSHECVLPSLPPALSLSVTHYSLILTTPLMRLQVCEVAPQLYGTGWCRLLFGRILLTNNAEQLCLWDYLVAPPVKSYPKLPFVKQDIPLGAHGSLHLNSGRRTSVNQFGVTDNSRRTGTEDTHTNRQTQRQTKHSDLLKHAGSSLSDEEDHDDEEEESDEEYEEISGGWSFSITKRLSVFQQKRKPPTSPNKVDGAVSIEVGDLDSSSSRRVDNTSTVHDTTTSMTTTTTTTSTTTTTMTTVSVTALNTNTPSDMDTDTDTHELWRDAGPVGPGHTTSSPKILPDSDVRSRSSIDDEEQIMNSYSGNHTDNNNNKTSDEVTYGDCEGGSGGGGIVVGKDGGSNDHIVTMEKDNDDTVNNNLKEEDIACPTGHNVEIGSADTDDWLETGSYVTSEDNDIEEDAGADVHSEDSDEELWPFSGQELLLKIGCASVAILFKVCNGCEV